ncbi:FAD:protein FMN transferase [Janthinobacterium agaricidamnosum]|uniref:FAD:protein FMN transferase n=1 Tax=Janthinobacterium agaricidamnosum NBRC 102515 = DSM 9628 TaxID=1349767 RepID=W0V5Z6_9BURK|nr:FAD:protein FMN transferase [Janthinobacterium agaricidamnosum]CDG84254.1 apbE family protein [Janthinobacterium agaricidamnosum NBRC 102515 = DSM 9628]
MRRVLLPHHFSGQPAPAHAPVRDFHGLSMGTSWSVKVVERGATHHLQLALQQQLDSVVAQMSHWSDTSALGRFNLAPAGSWHCLPAAFCEVLSFAMEVSHASGGAYDPCAGALVKLWGFGATQRYDQPGFVPPSAASVDCAVRQRRDRRLEFDVAARRARQPGGLLLDLSAVAKGYGVDRLASYLESQGIKHYLVEVGGELRGAGTRPDGQPWWVALEQVDGATEQQDGMVLALHGLAVATSGDYRRFFEDGGQRYSHTIDPRCGTPIANELASVTVVHAACMAADAWSTALTVLGIEAGLALAEQHGLAARFVVRDGSRLTEYLSSHLQGMLDQ